MNNITMMSTRHLCPTDTTSGNHCYMRMPTEKLVDGLQKTIEQYPIVVGRLVPVGNNRFEVHSLDSGVPYRESHCPQNISEFS